MSHTVFIYAKGCKTRRECDCLITNGRSHDEYESPWSNDVKPDHEVMQPPNPPYLQGEDFEEWKIRKAQAEAWEEGRESVWYEHSTRSIIENPYLKENV